MSTAGKVRAKFRRGVCPIAGCKGGYTQGEAPGDRRPEFRCTKCGHRWTQGKSGGKWLLR